MLIYGDSVPTQVLFAMLCDLHRHQLLANGTIPTGRSGAALWPDGAADSFNDKPLAHHWEHGVYVPALGLTLALIHQTTAAQRFCAAREAAIAAQRSRLGGTVAGRQGILPSRPCPAFFDAAARDYDVVRECRSLSAGGSNTPLGSNSNTQSPGFNAQSL